MLQDLIINMSTKKQIIKILDKDKWPIQMAQLINEQILLTLCTQKSCSVMLTGGKTAEKVYKAWNDILQARPISDVVFYLGDDRCVPINHVDSNYGLIMRTLFQSGIPLNCSFIPMEVMSANHEMASLDYEAKLPDKIDILLLSVGDDGHIASIFPNSNTISCTSRLVVPASSPSFKHARLTITPSTLKCASKIFVMAIGRKKEYIFSKAKISSSDTSDLPARLVLDATWIFNNDVKDCSLS
jgi:6-phosphogluconolactonase